MTTPSSREIAIEIAEASLARDLAAADLRYIEGGSKADQTHFDDRGEAHQRYLTALSDLDDTYPLAGVR